MVHDTTPIYTPIIWKAAFMTKADISVKMTLTNKAPPPLRTDKSAPVKDSPSSVLIRDVSPYKIVLFANDIVGESR